VKIEHFWRGNDSQAVNIRAMNRLHAAFNHGRVFAVIATGRE
jgi:hypothetical protein